MNTVHSLAQKHHPSIVKLRRHFHAHPELGTQEFETQARILQELTAIGIEGRPIAKTGVIAEIKGAQPGKTIAIRADIDALELTDECGKPYQSQNPGICHACGHDGHTAMLVGVAKILTEIKDQLAGNFRLLFQPNEELFPGGAVPMIEEGALDGVDAIIGAHLWQPVKAGTIGISFDRIMASPDEFLITIHGRGGHGSMPHQTVDALLISAELVVALNTIVSRSIDPLEQAVVSLGVLRAGDTFNIIPDTAMMRGTVRSFEPSVRTKIFDRIEQLTKGLCEANGASYKLEKFLGFPPIINDPAYAQVIKEAAEKAVGKENTLVVKPAMAGEDFSCFMEKVPGAYFFVGVGNPDKGIIYPQHHPKYDLDEDALLYGMETLTLAAIELARK
jgi:amidohydrolase